MTHGCLCEGYAVVCNYVHFKSKNINYSLTTYICPLSYRKPIVKKSAKPLNKFEDGD